MNTKRPLVSVITPVYNGEKYLSECILSVLQQSYENIEYIIVDNQSTDSTHHIIEEHSRKTKKFRFYKTPKFFTAIENWNYCLTKISAQASYIKYVHADDFIYENCIEKMVTLAEENQHIGVVSSYRLENNKVTNTGLDYRKNFFSGKEIIKEVLLTDFYFGSPTSLLYRRDLMQIPNFFNPNIVHADDDACFNLLLKSDFGFIHQVLNFTRRHPETETAAANKRKTGLLDFTRLIYNYSSDILSESEFKLLRSTHMSTYNKELAKFLLKQKFADYKYHKSQLKKLNVEIKIHTIVKNILLTLFEYPFRFNSGENK